MTAYLVNFVLCSALLLLFYYLLLEDKAMYVFNRFYLVSSIVFSLAIPLIIVENPVIENTPVQQVYQYVESQVPTLIYEQDLNELHITQSFDYPVIPWYTYFYAVVTSFFLFRFAKNMYRIYRRINDNQSTCYKSSKLVLLSEKLVPHTFLNYIFLNKEEYESGKLEENIIRHEMAHARQLHSIDIMLVELIKVFCWVNPLLVLYSRGIRLNHEFIADSEVLRHDPDVCRYQHLLVKKLSEVKGLSMTSQLNYSLTKKRLIMMTKSTSLKTVWLARLSVLPVLALAFVLFSNMTVQTQNVFASLEKEVIGKQLNNSPNRGTGNTPPPMVEFPFIGDFPSSKTPATQQVLNEYLVMTKMYATNPYYKNHDRLTVPLGDKKRMEQLYRQMNSEQQKEQSIVFGRDWRKPYTLHRPTNPLFESWKDPAVYGVWIDGKHIKNEELEKYLPTDVSFYSKSTLNYSAKNIKNIMTAFNLSVMYTYQLDIMSNSYFKKINAEIIAQKDQSLMFYAIRSSKGAGYSLLKTE